MRIGEGEGKRRRSRKRRGRGQGGKEVWRRRWEGTRRRGGTGGVSGPADDVGDGGGAL